MYGIYQKSVTVLVSLVKNRTVTGFFIGFVPFLVLGTSFEKDSPWIGSKFRYPGLQSVFYWAELPVSWFTSWIGVVLIDCSILASIVLLIVFSISPSNNAKYIRRNHLLGLSFSSIGVALGIIALRTLLIWHYFGPSPIDPTD